MTRPESEKLPAELTDPKPFSEPWEAQAFAMVVGLHEKGVFEWSEWATSLSRQLHERDAAVDGSDYYACWVRALEDLLDKRAIAAQAEIDQLQQAWERSAEATPHGRPIELQNDPQGSDR